jgi:lipopolysaccharide export LptBFGC system permease protein LptF
MRILDRYIVRSFLYAALLWFVVLMSMRILADLFINLDEFAEQGKTAGLMISHVASYYGYQSLTYLSQLGGVIIVAAATFTLAMMGHTNELTAMLASGVSLHRVVWPIILCSLVLGGILIIDQELIIPCVASMLVRHRDDVEVQNAFRMSFVPDGSGAVWRADSFIPWESRMVRPAVFIRDEEYRQIAAVFAASAVPAEFNGQGGWLMKEAVLLRSNLKERPWVYTPDINEIRTVNGPKQLAGFVNRPVSIEDGQYPMLLEAGAFIPSEKGRPARLEQPRFTFRTDDGSLLGVFVATEATWEPAEGIGAWKLLGGEFFFPTDLIPNDIVLRQSSRWLDYMSSSQLADLLQMKRVPDPDAARLVRHTRVTEPFNNLVMLLLALPFILSRERRDVKASASLCLLMVGAFYAFIYLCRNVGLPPTFGAWLPVMLFGPVAVVMLDSVKT